MSQKKLAIVTYGCQMNKYDVERMGGILTQNGYTVVDEPTSADVVLLHTCAVREKAEQKVFSQLGVLRRLKQENKDLIIGVGGCVAQLHGEEIMDRAPFVDLVFGTQNYTEVADLLREVEEGGRRVFRLEGGSDWYSDLDVGPNLRENPVSAWVNIMQGCDNNCTFCVVPVTRGPERSRPSQSIVQEIRSLAERGYKEVTLLGQVVNTYGKGLEEGIDFADLLDRVHGIDGIRRIRFVTSHPKYFSDKLIDRMAELPKVCEYLHLPVQSGSDRILEKMKRGYTSADYLERIGRIREKVSGIALSTDVIVGFPGETDSDLEDTLRLVKRVEFDTLFLFQYSPRPETEAAAFPDHSSREVKQERFDAILSAQKEITLRKNMEQTGSVQEVLCEGMSKKDSTWGSGRTRTNKVVNFPSGRDLTGELVQVKIVAGKPNSLEGRLLAHS